MFTFPILLTMYAGFTHAFEADHLLAVSTMVSRRNSVRSSVKDGMFWGLGHASTIFLVGILMILFKLAISDLYFHYFEAMVGCMLIALAIYRSYQLVSNRRQEEKVQVHRHVSPDGSIAIHHSHKHAHSLAYGVGLVHGLAGSGALIVVVMSGIKTAVDGFTYLFVFGATCIVGMMLAAGLFSIPFSRKILKEQQLQTSLVVMSAVLCLIYGIKVLYENLVLQQGI